MNLTKKELVSIKKVLNELNETIPQKTKNSLVLASTIDVTSMIFSIYNLIETDIETQVIIKSLLASGITTSFIIILLIHYINLDNEKQKNEEINNNKIKVLKK